MLHVRHGIVSLLSVGRWSCHSSPFRVLSTTVSGDTQRLQSFLDPEVQSLLKQLTGRDYCRIFRNRKIGQKLHEPKISFMTSSELETTIKNTEERANHLLQMPPVLAARSEDEKVLSFDPRIQCHDESAFVFTDISLNSDSRDRLIVIRDLDGTLRHADRETRRKMNNIYFPVDGREFVVPKMFTDPQVLKEVLDRSSSTDNTYEFVLDRACVQFDPDDPEYIAVVEATYDHVDDKRTYDLLKSTRHYGPLVFYLTRKRKIDSLLIYNIEKERIESDAVPLVTLFTRIFPECKSKAKIDTTSDPLDKVRHYVQLDSLRRGELELGLNAYQELKLSREQVTEGLQRAHGF